jgi:hypothetical protein
VRFVSLQGEWDDLVEVVDHVRIPAGTKPGRYVLGWRWCANTNADNDQPSASSSASASSSSSSPSPSSSSPSSSSYSSFSYSSSHLFFGGATTVPS